MDIRNFYLKTPMARKEYIRLKLSDMPDNTIEDYCLRDKAMANGYVYVVVSQGIYGLPQAVKISQRLLEERLGKEGQFQGKFTPGVWSHKWCPVQFSLVVDDFGVKYIGKEHTEHLVGVIKQHYEMMMDWEGKKYC